jgi:hypothetical protein
VLNILCLSLNLWSSKIWKPIINMDLM